MQESMMPVNNSRYSFIYVEKRAFSYPATEIILQKFPRAEVISISHYKDIFNRKKQDRNWQRKYPSLILAVKDAPYLYEGPDICQSFSCDRFFYTSFLIGCPFDCEYCYLQGMYPSSFTVAFVNIDDFQKAILETLNESPKEKVYIAASYDTDILAFHNTYPYLDLLYPYLQEKKNLLFEVRTKAAPARFFSGHAPAPSLIYAFSLAPDEVISRYEKNTPSLSARLKAIQNAQENGFTVRICLDPIFAREDLLPFYPDFFRRVFTELNPDKIRDVGYGFFRMNDTFFRRIRKKSPDSGLFLQDFPNAAIVTYEKDLRTQVKKEHLDILSSFIDRERIFTL